jgi:hypothetical protein
MFAKLLKDALFLEQHTLENWRRIKLYPNLCMDIARDCIHPVITGDPSDSLDPTITWDPSYSLDVVITGYPSDSLDPAVTGIQSDSLDVVITGYPSDSLDPAITDVKTYIGPYAHEEIQKTCIISHRTR